jgi:hypothetical protein
VWGNEVFHSHLHDDVVAVGDLLAERVPQVHPQPVSTLVLIAQAKVFPLQQTQRFAYLQRTATSVSAVNIHKLELVCEY